MPLESLSESGGGGDEDTLFAERKPQKLDHTIIKAQAESGALYNFETAPVVNLPIEILCKIFEAAQDASRIHTVSKHRFVEVIISHVCKGWRSVALSFPPLWSTFRYDRICDQADGQSGNRLDVYLERSSSHLLDLYFHFEYSTTLQGLFMSMLERTLPHVARWRRFFLTYNNTLDFPDRFKYRLEAPNLEYLSLGPATLYSGTFLRDTSKLCYLRMDTPCPSQYFPLLSNITVLRIEDHFHSGRGSLGSWNDFLEILALPSLSSLSIVGQHFGEPKSQHSSNIIMKNLKHLRYGEENMDLFGHFFPFLSAPLLETLVLRGLNSLSLDLVNREPFYMLHSLTVICCPSHLFLNLAAITPSLTHLTLSDIRPPKCIIEQFDKDGNNLWAKLKVLTGMIHDDSSTFGFFLEFARMMANPDLIIRTSASIVKEWAREANIKQLLALCVLEDMPMGNQQIPWPPGADVPVEIDFFTVFYY